MPKFNYVIAFGLPTSQESYYRQIATPENRDFVVRCCPTWQQYYHEFVRHLLIVEPYLQGFGVKLVYDVTPLGLHDLLASDWDAAVLFSHWTANSIELTSGLTPIDEVIANVPNEFSGVLDLCICHPVRLVLALKQQRPRCLIKFTNTNATPSYWLYFYLILFKIIFEESVSYLEALERTVRTFVPQLNK